MGKKAILISYSLGKKLWKRKLNWFGHIFSIMKIAQIHLLKEKLVFPGGRKVAQKKYFMKNKEYLLRVIYEEKEELKVIVTAYITSQLSRYWREREK